MEKEWKEKFEEMFEEAFNRFEYDFGVTFDEDFQVCGNSEEPTDELEVLFKDWKELIEPVKKFLGKDKFDKNIIVSLEYRLVSIVELSQKFLMNGENLNF